MLSSTSIAYANRVYNTVKSAGGTDFIARVIASQAAHESGGFTSNLFMRANNTFGMKIPSVRKTPYIIGDAGSGYAKYANIEGSVNDLLNWLKYNHIDYTTSNNNTDSISSYLTALKSKGYFEDTLQNYNAGVNKFFSQITNFLKANTPFSVALVLAALGFLIILYYSK